MELPISCFILPTQFFQYVLVSIIDLLHLFRLYPSDDDLCVGVNLTGKVHAGADIWLEGATFLE